MKLSYRCFWFFFSFCVCLTMIVSARAQGTRLPEEVVAQMQAAVVMIESNIGWGTGFFVSSDGYLVTNNHVIENAQRVTVIYRNRERLAANVVITDPGIDLAILKVETATAFPTVALGDSDEVKEGMAIAVTGYPRPDVLIGVYGSSLQCSTSRGIVSACRRNSVPGVEQSRPLLQYDAGTTHGNSGGPIYRLDTGEVVGVVCLGTRAIGFLNMGVPINEAKLLLQKAAVAVSPAIPDPASASSLIAPGDVSLLNIIGPDKAIASLFARRTVFPLAPKDYRELSDQIYSNAGYFSCYGKLAPPVSQPTLIGRKMVFTGNDGRVRVYDPSKAVTAEPMRALFNVDKRYMFFPAQGNDRQILFSAGTPTFLAKEKVNKSRLFLAILASAAAGYAGKQSPRNINVVDIVPTIDSDGSILAINSNNGNLDWEYQCGFVGTPILKGNRIYFGGMGIYGVLDATTGQEIWVHREKLGGTTAKWYTPALGENTLYLAVSPVEVKFYEGFPGYIVIGNGDLLLMARAIADGKKIWDTKVTNISDQINPLAVGLAVDESTHMLYITRMHQAFAYGVNGKNSWTYGGPVKKSDKKQEKGTKEIISTLTEFATEISHTQDQLFLAGDDGKLYCLDAKTGRERWTFTGLSAMSDPVLLGNTVFCGSADGWLYAVDPTTGVLRWKVDTNAVPVGKPLLYEGALYFSAQEPGGTSGALCSVYLPK